MCTVACSFFIAVLRRASFSATVSPAYFTSRTHTSGARKDRALFPDLTRKVIADGKCGMFLCHHGLKFSSLGSIYHSAVKA